MRTCESARNQRRFGLGLWLGVQRRDWVGAGFNCCTLHIAPLVVLQVGEGQGEWGVLRGAVREAGRVAVEYQG